MNRVFYRITLWRKVDREIFTKHSHRQIAARQFPFPVVVMSKRIAVDRFVFSSVHGEIGLPVAIQVQFAQCNRASDWLFEYAGDNRATMPDDLSRQSNVN